MNAKLEIQKVLSFCQKSVLEEGAFDNLFLTNLENGDLSLEEFKLTQEQFFFAVSFFSRPMSALMARFPDPLARIKILENVLEEHGSFNQCLFHESTFKEFLESLDLDVERLNEVDLWPEVRAFNSTLMTACVFDEIEVGVGCMGAIEFMFAEISYLIGQAVIKNGWVNQEDLKHYALHEKLDVQHADDFFQLVEKQWSDDKKCYHIKQGIKMGIYIFDRLYRDLYSRAKISVTK